VKNIEFIIDNEELEIYEKLFGKGKINNKNFKIEKFNLLVD
jgi:hypothetical protein